MAELARNAGKSRLLGCERERPGRRARNRIDSLEEVYTTVQDTSLASNTSALEAGKVMQSCGQAQA